MACIYKVILRCCLKAKPHKKDLSRIAENVI